MVAGEVGNIVKYFALGLESTACKRIMLNPDLSRNVKKLVIKEMDNELEELCKKKKNSILRQTKQEELLVLKIEKFTQEIEQQTPLMFEFFAEQLQFKYQEDLEKCNSKSMHQGNHYSCHLSTKMSRNVSRGLLDRMHGMFFFAL